MSAHTVTYSASGLKLFCGYDSTVAIFDTDRTRPPFQYRSIQLARTVPSSPPLLTLTENNEHVNKPIVADDRTVVLEAPSSLAATISPDQPIGVLLASSGSLAKRSDARGCCLDITTQAVLEAVTESSEPAKVSVESVAGEDSDQNAPPPAASGRGQNIGRRRARSSSPSASVGSASAPTTPSGVGRAHHGHPVDPSAEDAAVVAEKDAVANSAVAPGALAGTRCS